MSRFWQCIDEPTHKPVPQSELLAVANATGCNRYTCPECAKLGREGKPHGFGYMRPADSKEFLQTARIAA